MAEAVLRNALGEQDEITVESAGLGALVDRPAEEHAVALLLERGIDISAHRARQLTPELLHEADLILVMESRYKKAVKAEDSTVRGKLFRLGEWRDEDIHDPYQKSKIVFANTLDKIDMCVEDWVARLKE